MHKNSPAKSSKKLLFKAKHKLLIDRGSSDGDGGAMSKRKGEPASVALKHSSPTDKRSKKLSKAKHKPVREYDKGSDSDAKYGANTNNAKPPKKSTKKTNDESRPSPQAKTSGGEGISSSGIKRTPPPRRRFNLGLDKKVLKPALKAGDKVYAAWWASARDKRENNDPQWYPGKIKSVEKGVFSPGCYGPTRYYSIEYDDGDELNRVGDCYVFTKKDYLLMNSDRGSDSDKGDEWMGVNNITDSLSRDEWARYVGWWVAAIEGQSYSFSTLSGALRAYDASVIRMKGDDTQPSDLNLPEEWE